jgi:hypothetical protein
MVIKKLIAISVVFALVAGTAFAVDLGGAVISSVEVASKAGAGDASLFANGGVGRARLEGSGEAEIGIGTIGGWIRFDGGSGTFSGQGKAWWQPIEQLRIQLGHNGDGEYDTHHIVRYGFNAQANEIGELVKRNMWSGVVGSDQTIYGGDGGSDARDVAFIITPMDGVSINIAFPWAGGAPGDVFKKVLFQVNYNADFGAIHITYDGKDTAALMGNFYASAYLGSLVDGLGLEVGAKFGIKGNGATATKPPLNVGLGVKYDVSEQFGVKLRSFFGIPMESGGDFNMSVDLLPYYAINENVTGYLNIGIVKGTDMTFTINPYVRVGAEWGSSFYAGMYFSNDGGGSHDSGVKSAKMSWGIPIGLVATF